MLSGKRMAIDANASFYGAWSEVVRQVCTSSEDLLERGIDLQQVRPLWSKIVLSMLKTWTDLGMTIVICLDGEAPKMKAKTQEGRISSSTGYLDRASEQVRLACEALGREYEESMICIGPLSEDPLERLEQMPLIAPYRKEHSMCLKNALGPRKDDWRHLASDLQREGYKVVRSNVEAETLACKMALEGKVDYVYSRDSDCLAYGIPCWLNRWDSWKSCFMGYTLEDVIKYGRLKDKSHLLMMCILLGCDYNNNLKDISFARVCGTEKKQGLIQKYSSFEELQDSRKDLDYSVLNIEECLDIFLLRGEVYESENKDIIGSDKNDVIDEDC